jgi:hypothetical protein
LSYSAYISEKLAETIPCHRWRRLLLHCVILLALAAAVETAAHAQFGVDNCDNPLCLVLVPGFSFVAALDPHEFGATLACVINLLVIAASLFVIGFGTGALLKRAQQR